MANPESLPRMLAPFSDIPDFTTAPIIVEVGTPSTIFHVNEHLLIASSDYFKAALAPEWEEGKTRTVTLPDDDAGSFSLYLAWLHTSCIHLDVDGIKLDTWLALFKAYVLGDKLLDTVFKDVLTDTAAIFLETLTACEHITMPMEREIKLLYQDTLPSTPMRRVVVYKWARLDNWESLLTEGFHVAFLIDLCKEVQVVARAEGKGVKDVTISAAATLCAFHEHEPGAENCYRAKRH